MAVTFDTGALIALEKRRRFISKVVAAAATDEILVPATVVAEWWRGGRVQKEILESLTIIKLDVTLSKLAGEALAELHLSIKERIDAKVTIDAAVMATAARFAPQLYTGDHEDMARFADFFPNVRLFGLRPESV